MTQDELDALIEERLAGLKANRDDALKEAKAAKKKLENYDGVDPDEFKRLKAESDKAQRDKAAAEGDFKALEKQLVERHTQEIGAKDTRISKLSKALERRLIDAELTRAIAAQKGDPDLLLPFARQFGRVRETDDDFEGFVADERGQPLVADGKGTPMSFDLFVEQTLKTKFPRAFDGTGSSGGGAAKSIASGNGGSKVIPAGDNAAFLASVEDIASGKATVGA